MFKIKIILTLLLLAGAAGGFAYVQKLRADNAVLKINQEKLESMDCFQKYGNYTNSNNLPTWARLSE